MTSLRDTSADAAAALHDEQARERLGMNDPSVEISGYGARHILAKAKAACDELERIAARTKAYREAARIRDVRVDLVAAVSILKHQLESEASGEPPREGHAAASQAPPASGRSADGRTS